MDEARRFEAARRGGALGLTLLAALVTAVLLLLAFSSSFLEALGLFFLGPFGNAYAFGNMLGSCFTLALAGLAASVAFASKNFNLGGEGQIYSGAIATAAACLAFPDGNVIIVPIIGLAAGMAAGAALGWLSGALKRGLGVEELISSFLLSAAAAYAGDYLITGPLQDPASNFQSTASLPEAFRFARIMPPSNLSSAAFLVACLIALAAFAMSRTRFGFELRLTGQNREFARYVGVDTGRYATLPMALSGALNGLVGAVLILGTYYKAVKGFSSGLGWTGIAVALVAGNRPAALIPAAFLFAWLDAGAKSVMIGADVTQEIVSVIQAVIFFLVTARALDSLFGRRGHGRR
jgi:simple sugar transport system permease protein